MQEIRKHPLSEIRYSRLLVGNLGSQTTETEVRALVVPFGEIKRIQMMMDHATGLSRGYAFVEMADEDEAARVITELDGKEVDGRFLKVITG
jgi:RNA recognition motif-containing protein